MKFSKETLAGAVFVVFRVLLWLPVLAAAAFFGAALGDLLVSFAAEHLSPAAVGILAGLLTLAVVRSKPPLHTPFERMEQFKQKHHLDRLASFQLEFTLLCMVAFFLSISGIAVFSAAFDSLCAEDLIVPVGWIVCTCLCLFFSSFFIFNLFDLVILWSALSILAVGCALLISFPSYAVYVPLTAAFGAAALFLGAAAGPAFLKKMEDDAALFCMLRRLRLAEIAVYLLFLLLGQNGMLTLSDLRINLFLTSMIFPLIVLEFCTLAFLQPFRHRRLEACFAALFHCILLYCGGCPGGDLLLTAALCVLVLLVTAPQPHPQRRKRPAVRHPGLLLALGGAAGFLLPYAAALWNAFCDWCGGQFAVGPRGPTWSEVAANQHWLLVVSSGSAGTNKTTLAFFGQILIAANRLGPAAAVLFAALLALLLLSSMAANRGDPRRSTMAVLIVSFFAAQMLLHTLACTGVLPSFLGLNLPWLDEYAINGLLARCGCMFLTGLLIAPPQTAAQPLLLPEQIEMEEEIRYDEA